MSGKGLLGQFEVPSIVADDWRRLRVVDIRDSSLKGELDWTTSLSPALQLGDGLEARVKNFQRVALDYWTGAHNGQAAYHGSNGKMHLEICSLVFQQKSRGVLA